MNYVNSPCPTPRLQGACSFEKCPRHSQAVKSIITQVLAAYADCQHTKFWQESKLSGLVANTWDKLLRLKPSGYDADAEHPQGKETFADRRQENSFASSGLL